MNFKRAAGAKDASNLLPGHERRAVERSPGAARRLHDRATARERRDGADLRRIARGGARLPEARRAQAHPPGARVRDHRRGRVVDGARARRPSLGEGATSAVGLVQLIRAHAVGAAEGAVVEARTIRRATANAQAKGLANTAGNGGVTSLERGRRRQKSSSFRHGQFGDRPMSFTVFSSQQFVSRFVIQNGLALRVELQHPSDAGCNVRQMYQSG